MLILVGTEQYWGTLPVNHDFMNLKKKRIDWDWSMVGSVIFIER